MLKTELNSKLNPESNTAKLQFSRYFLSLLLYSQERFNDSLIELYCGKMKEQGFFAIKYCLQCRSFFKRINCVQLSAQVASKI